jgi:hypothetical protein
VDEKQGSRFQGSVLDKKILYRVFAGETRRILYGQRRRGWGSNWVRVDSDRRLVRATNFPLRQKREKLAIEKLNGGAERDRTVGLLNAIQALSQLSYSPTMLSF